MIGPLHGTDTVLIILLIGFAAWGFSNGLIRAVGGIIGIIIAASVASRNYLWLTDIIQPYFGSYAALAPMLAFALLFLIVGRLFGLVVWLFEKAFNVLAIIPFLKSINRIFGTIFGVVLGVLVIGTLLYVIGKYSVWTPFNDAIAKSQGAQYLLAVSGPLRLLFPQTLLELRSYF